MPRESRSSIKRSENGATYYVRSRTVSQSPCFADDAVKEWVYRHILWMGNIYYVTFRAVSVTDDRYQLVLSMNKPKPSEGALEKRFRAIQRTNRLPLKWYPWRVKEWYEKLTDLSEFMKRLNQSIARYVQETQGHRGQVWRDRFKAGYLEEDADILSNMAFVELSCVRAGLEMRPGSYRWCSVGRIMEEGRQAAGIGLPNRAAFAFLGKGEQRYKTYCLFADRLVRHGHAVKAAPALKDMFDAVNPRTFLRTQRRLGHAVLRLPVL